jgi:hypothetical protein
LVIIDAFDAREQYVTAQTTTQLQELSGRRFSEVSHIESQKQGGEAHASIVHITRFRKEDDKVLKTEVIMGDWGGTPYFAFAFV